jgi:CRP-like cAMP-binding protein
MTGIEAPRRLRRTPGPGARRVSRRNGRSDSLGVIPRTSDAPFERLELWELAGNDGLARIDAGTKLISEGEPVESVYLIRSGEVEVYRLAGRRRLVVQILHPGDMLGLIPHLQGRPARYNARAISPIEAVRLRPDAVTWLLQSRPTLCHQFVVYLAGHLERMARRVEELSGAELPSRVATVLLDQTLDGRRILRLPQATLADLIGASRPTVNRVLKDLAAAGMIRIAYRRVEILDAARLRALTV